MMIYGTVLEFRGVLRSFYFCLRIFFLCYLYHLLSVDAAFLFHWDSVRPRMTATVHLGQDYFFSFLLPVLCETLGAV